MSDVVTILGRVLDFSAATGDSVPLLVSKTVWDAGVASDFYGTDGDYIKSNNQGADGDYTYSITPADSKLALADTSGIIIGMYCFMDDKKAATTNAIGYYRITAIDTNVSITIEIDAVIADVLAESSTEVDYYIGGVSDALTSDVTLQANLDHLGTYAADGTNNVDILCYSSVAVTLGATVDIDNITGSSTTKAKLIGTNSSFVNDGTKVLINTGDAITTGLFKFFDISLYLTFKNIKWDAADVATYGLFHDSTGGGDVVGPYEFIDCQITRATSHGVYGRVNSAWYFTNCEIDNNGGSGIQNSAGARGRYYASYCYIHDNTSHGVSLRINDSILNNNRISNNGGDGIVSGAITGIELYNNTCYGNGGDGINLSAVIPESRVYNNTSSNNGGYGYNINSTNMPLIYKNNHADGNNLGDVTYYCNLTASLAEFEVLFDGDNIGGDPDFADLIEFIPNTSSPLIDAGVGGTGDTIGALCATAGGGGGVNLLQGLLG